MDWLNLGGLASKATNAGDDNACGSQLALAFLAKKQDIAVIPIQYGCHVHPFKELLVGRINLFPAIKASSGRGAPCAVVHTNASKPEEATTIAA